MGLSFPPHKGQTGFSAGNRKRTVSAARPVIQQITSAVEKVGTAAGGIIGLFMRFVQRHHDLIGDQLMQLPTDISLQGMDEKPVDEKFPSAAKTVNDLRISF